jgi:hypothetical protein
LECAVFGCVPQPASKQQKKGLFVVDFLAFMNVCKTPQKYVNSTPIIALIYLLSKILSTMRKFAHFLLIKH